MGSRGKKVSKSQYQLELSTGGLGALTHLYTGHGIREVSACCAILTRMPASISNWRLGGSRVSVKHAVTFSTANKVGTMTPYELEKV